MKKPLITMLKLNEQQCGILSVALWEHRTKLKEMQERLSILGCREIAEQMPISVTSDLHREVSQRQTNLIEKRYKQRDN